MVRIRRKFDVWKFELKSLTHVGFCSKSWSDTFRSVLVYGKEQESRKKIFHNRAKKFIFLRVFDRRNTFF